MLGVVTLPLPMSGAGRHGIGESLNLGETNGTVELLFLYEKQESEEINFSIKITFCYSNDLLFISVPLMKSFSHFCLI